MCVQCAPDFELGTYIFIFLTFSINEYSSKIKINNKRRM